MAITHKRLIHYLQFFLRSEGTKNSMNQRLPHGGIDSGRQELSFFSWCHSERLDQAKQGVNHERLTRTSYLQTPCAFGQSMRRVTTV
jgi:hypothetical protein